MILKGVKKGIISISIILNVGLFISLFTPLNELLYRFLTVNIPPQKGDVIVICSSNFFYDTEKGVPDLSTLLRLEKGLELYRKGYAPKIISFGGIWMKESEKTTAKIMKERLLLYGVPQEDIIVQDEIIGKLHYYENILLMFEKYKNRFDFNRAIFVTSADQSFRLYHCLLPKIEKPIVVTCEPYEIASDWGQRFQVFRRIANEIFFGIPYFYFTGRFSKPSTFKWVVGNPNIPNQKNR